MTSRRLVRTELATHFAAVPYGEEIALYRAGAEGLAGTISSDGVRWHAAEPDQLPSSRNLRPLCGGVVGSSGNRGLFCLDPEGRLMAVATAEGQHTISAPFRPVTTPEPWYESMPNPEETAIIWDAEQ